MIFSPVTDILQLTEIAQWGNLPPEHQEPAGSQPTDFASQVGVAETQRDPPTSTFKPKLSIRIPRRGSRNKQTPSSRGSVPNMPSQTSISHVSVLSPICI